uniref:Uncharacterized protein n=1 Tax=Cacopsylla melanoneura TaxID=428564 RepID=A0A8D9FCQ9_9HEMI
MQCAILRRTIAQCLFHPFTMPIIIKRYHNIVRYHNVSNKEFYNNSNTTLDITLNTKKSSYNRITKTSTHMVFTLSTLSRHTLQECKLQDTIHVKNEEQIQRKKNI